jgi:hypothetical protein
MPASPIRWYVNAANSIRRGRCVACAWAAVGREVKKERARRDERPRWRRVACDFCLTGLHMPSRRVSPALAGCRPSGPRKR